MDEHAIRELVGEVRRGRLSRRRFVQAMAAVGLTAPMAARILRAAGLAEAQPKPSTAVPTRRGGGGAVRMLYWAAPTLLNPHLAVAPKDFESSQLFYEPLADIDTDGTIVPVLAAETPSVANGGVAPDGTWVQWRLKRGVAWHDGRPFTADDVIFTWQYAADPATAAPSAGSYQGIERIDRIDDHTVKVVFKRPTPYWADAFCSAAGMVLPRHVFEAFRGGKSREAAANLRPVGTGPYRFVDFKPGDVLHGEINGAYHVANRPFFDTVEMKGGGDAVSAARAVLQTGEYDYAWNLQVEDEILKRLEQGGRGKVDIVAGGDIEHIQCNFTDPWKEVDGERSSLKTKHPFLSDPAVRQALGLLVDRSSVQEQIYCRTGISTANFLNAPERFRSKTTKWEFNVDKANQILDAAGWKRGGDGIREKGGVKLKMVYQSSTNASRQKTQAIVKQAAAKAGIEMEIKSVVASVYFSSDAANLDTYPHFSTDIQMYTTTMTQPDPELFMIQFASWEAASKDNKWQGRNITRWKNEEYDKLYRASEGELDVVKRAALYVKMNEMVIQNGVVIPVVWRPRVRAIASKLRLEQSGWDSDFWNLAHWYREA